MGRERVRERRWRGEESRVWVRVKGGWDWVVVRKEEAIEEALEE